MSRLRAIAASVGLMVAIALSVGIAPAGADSCAPSTTFNTANPCSTLVRPGDTNAYAQNDLIANNTSGPSVVVPSLTAMATSGGSALLRRVRLYTNATTGMGSATFKIEFWTAPPTFTNGDNGAYAVATGAANWLGSASISTMTQAADGAYGAGTPDVGSDIDFKLATGGTIYWTLQATAAFTPISGQTFTLAAELLKDNP